MIIYRAASDGVGPVACQAEPPGIKSRVQFKFVAPLRPPQAPVPEEYKEFADAPTPWEFDTPLAFLARHNPESLSFLSDPVTAVLAEYETLFAMCRKEGLHSVEVPAPTALVRRGFNKTIAFPVEILKALFL